MAIAWTSSCMFVRSVAVMAAGVALTTDMGPGEHPTHSVVLSLVAVVVWIVHGRLTRHAIALTTFPAVSAALAAQPALHLASKIGRPPADARDYESLLHFSFASDALAAGMQIVVPVVALVAATLVAHLLYLMLNAARYPHATVGAAFGAPARVRSPIRIRRLGSMLRWCGWVLQAARRGPPPPQGTPLSDPCALPAV